MKIVVVSGWAFPKDSLSRLSAGLSALKETVILPIDELPLFIESGMPLQKARDADISGYARGLISFIYGLNEPCILIGWSAGGMITLEAAAYLTDKASGLFLVSSTARFTSAKDYQHGAAPAALRLMKHEMGKDPEGRLRDFLVRVHQPFNEAADHISGEVKASLSIGGDALSAGLAYLLNTDLRDLPGSINIPSAVIHGKEDAVIPWQAAEMLSDKLQNSSFRLIEGSGHDLPLRCPELLIEEVRKTIKTIT